MTTYVFNAKTLGLSRYTGVTFEDIVSRDDTLYGVVADGLRELTGTTDDGTDIDAYVETGKVHFGDGQLKRFFRLYTEGSAAKGATAVVTTQERGTAVVRSYSMNRWTGDLRERRAKLSRKAKSRYVKVKLSNVSGGTFDVTRMALYVKGLLRRI